MDRYARGECTKEERLAIENWIPDDSDISDKLTKDQSLKSKSNVWNRLLKERLADQENSDRTFGTRKLIRAVAAIAILISVGSTAYLFVNNNRNQDEEFNLSIGNYQSVIAEKGERLTVNLPDGSTVRLNSKGVLKFPEKFKDGKRVVYLEGQAHFDVFRNSEEPFIVYTDKSRTEVLGTSFDINTSSGIDQTRIIVTSGKVRFSERDNSENQTNLSLNQLATLKDNTSIEVDEIDAAKLTAWKDDRLVFELQPLDEIVEIIEFWYDVKVRVNDTSLLHQEYNLSKDNPSLIELMDDLSLLGDFEYRINGKEVIIGQLADGK